MKKQNLDLFGTLAGLILATLQTQVTWAQSKPALLITAFEPFNGSFENNSLRVLRELEKNSELSSAFELHTCVLPVVFDQASKDAIHCLKKIPAQVSAVISLGEARCHVQLERRFANWDAAGIADNSGQIRSGSLILRGGPQAYAPTLPVQSMMDALEPKDLEITIWSSDAGGFVCNNTAYRMAHELRSWNGRGLPYAFIHVPNTSCDSRVADPARLSDLIVRMLKAI
jgi:pyroglutamyl-peptidase